MLLIDAPEVQQALGSDDGGYMKSTLQLLDDALKRVGFCAIRNVKMIQALLR